MTTVMGIQGYKTRHVLMLGDSRTVAGDKPMRHALQPKIRERDNYLFGCAGSGAACDLVLWQWQPPFYHEDLDPYEHMVRTFVPSLRTALDETCPAKEGEYELQMLVAVGGTLFLIENDLTVLLDDRLVYGIGTGGNLAVAAYLGGADCYTAMDIAIDLDVNSGGPVTELTQGE